MYSKVVAPSTLSRSSEVPKRLSVVISILRFRIVTTLTARDCREGLEFDQERFVPFFYSQVTDRISVAAELEIEHGGPQGNQDDGAVKMEFATMDYRFDDWANLRAGIVLIPMGRFNLTA